MPAQNINLNQPAAGALTRYTGNPVLEYINEHSWESKYVFNAGAIKIDSKVYLVYRAVGEDNVSRLGLAVSEDGLRFTERLEKPIFEPKGKSEEQGCEDPRLILIDDRIYMVYTAYDGLVAQIALAWLLSMPGVATVIPSCSTPQQLVENAAASGVRLTTDEMQQIEQARSGESCE